MLIGGALSQTKIAIANIFDKFIDFISLKTSVKYDQRNNDNECAIIRMTIDSCYAHDAQPLVMPYQAI